MAPGGPPVGGLTGVVPGLEGMVLEAVVVLPLGLKPYQSNRRDTSCTRIANKDGFLLPC